MEAAALWQRLRRRLFRRHGTIKSFGQEVEAAGGLTGRHDAGVRVIRTQKGVGERGGGPRGG